MTKQQVIDFLMEGFSLAKLPDSFMRLRQIANDPHSDIDDLVAVIRMDSQLATNLLRLANSSHYNSSGEQLGTIEEAAQLLGLRKVLESSLALGIIKQIDIGESGFDLLGFWRRSLSVATIAEDIYERAPRLLKTIVDRKHLYTAGLLHDIGLVALIQGFPDEMDQLLESAMRDGVPLQNVEHREFGFTHQDVGRILFKKWGLPEELQCVAGFHHNPLELKRRLYYPLVDLVNIADYVCCVGEMSEPSPFTPVMFEEVWRRSGLNLELVDEFSDRVTEVVAGSNAILSC